jgi:hypothetical protein
VSSLFAALEDVLRAQAARRPVRPAVLAYYATMGPDALTRTAHHEAGHVVALLALGRPFDRVSLVPSVFPVSADEDGAGAGVELGEHATMPGNFQAVLRRINTDLGEMTFRMAGPAAELRYLGGLADERLVHGARQDVQYMGERAQRMGWARALQLVNARWPVVQRVARALEERLVLTADEVAALAVGR